MTSLALQQMATLPRCGRWLPQLQLRVGLLRASSDLQASSSLPFKRPAASHCSARRDHQQQQQQQQQQQKQQQQQQQQRIRGDEERRCVSAVAENQSDAYLQRLRRWETKCLRSHPSSPSGWDCPSAVSRRLTTFGHPNYHQHHHHQQHHYQSSRGALSSSPEDHQRRARWQSRRAPFTTRSGDGEGDGTQPAASSHRKATISTTYSTAADAALQRICDVIESAKLEAVTEVDCSEGVLVITVQDTGTFVLNKHYVNEQLWYSSPLSGPDYFDFNPHDGLFQKWISARSGKSVDEKLGSELSQAVGQTVSF